MTPVTHRAQTFERLRDTVVPARIRDVVAVDCKFVACHFGESVQAPDERARIERLTLVNCIAANNCAVGPAILDTVDVDGLETEGLAIVWGAAFRRVRIRGRCGRIMSAPLPTVVHSAEKREAFAKADELFYREVDWALDIAEAEFQECDLRNVPVRLIRRDPTTQLVVRREVVAAKEPEWRRLDLSDTPWQKSLVTMLQLDIGDRVLVAPKRNPSFRRWLRGLHLSVMRGSPSDASRVSTLGFGVDVKVVGVEVVSSARGAAFCSAKPLVGVAGPLRCGSGAWASRGVHLLRFLDGVRPVALLLGVRG